MWIAEIVGLVLLAAVLMLGLLAWRRLRLVRRGGIDVAVRDQRRWHLGVARYHGDEFVWYRVASLRSGPDRVVRRRVLDITGRRDPSGQEAYALPAGSVVLSCRTGGREFELAMGADALTGFLSWLESAPPGAQHPLEDQRPLDEVSRFSARRRASTARRRPGWPPGPG